jgi:hypothetical protein
MASKRYVTLPNGKKVGLGEYVRGWKVVRELPPAQLCRGWDYFEIKAASILRDLRDGMHDRINRHIEGYGQGRKWSSDWQGAARRTAYDVNTPRLVVRWVPFEFRARLAHRLHVD